MAQILKDSMSFAKYDMQARMLKEQQIEALRVVEALNAALAEAKSLLSADELTELEAEIDKLVQLRESANSPERLKTGISALNNASADFTAHRMDDSIKKAVTGQSVDQV